MCPPSTPPPSPSPFRPPLRSPQPSAPPQHAPRRRKRWLRAGGLGQGCLLAPDQRGEQSNRLHSLAQARAIAQDAATDSRPEIAVVDAVEPPDALDLQRGEPPCQSSWHTGLRPTSAKNEVIAAGGRRIRSRRAGRAPGIARGVARRSRRAPAAHLALGGGALHVHVTASTGGRRHRADFLPRPRGGGLTWRGSVEHRGGPQER
jgi:hypothetical protein